MIRPVLCGCFDESVLHILKTCSYARLMWTVSPFSNIFVACNPESMCDWMAWVRNKVTQDELALFVSICWRIWGSRNKFLDENFCYDA